MSRRSGLRHPEVIDLVLRSPDKTRLDLVVLDIGDIGDSQQRLEALQLKLLACANFVADGQYREHAPDIRSENVAVRVVCKTEPTEKMRSTRCIQLTDANQETISVNVTVESDFEFRHRVASELGTIPPSLFPESKPWWKIW
jgi:hypothetical protein